MYSFHLGTEGRFPFLAIYRKPWGLYASARVAPISARVCLGPALPYRKGRLQVWAGFSEAIVPPADMDDPVRCGWKRAPIYRWPEARNAIVAGSLASIIAAGAVYFS